MPVMQHEPDTSANAATSANADSESDSDSESYPEPPSAILLAHITIPLHIFASGKYTKLAKHCGLFFEHVDKLPPPCDLQHAQTHINDLFEKIVNALRTEHAAAVKSFSHASKNTATNAVTTTTTTTDTSEEPFKITNSEVSSIAESILSEIPRLFITQTDIESQQYNHKRKSAQNRLTRTMRINTHIKK